MKVLLLTVVIIPIIITFCYYLFEMQKFVYLPIAFI